MKHLLDTHGLAYDDAVQLLDTAETMADVLTRDVPKLPALRGRTVVNLFYEDSTRTRGSFELAEKRLSADSMNVAAKGSSVSKGESMRDTLLTLDAMGVDAFVIRHAVSGSVAQATGWVGAHIINAGDGWHAHPTQALLDAYVMRQHFRAHGGTDWAGKTVAIVGDIKHSRVARSNVWLQKTLGARVVLVAPPTLQPAGIGDWGVDVVTDLDEIVDSADIMMMLRVQRERMEGGFFPSTREYAERYGLTPARVDRMKSDAAICHPGPMNRGVEISAAAADAANSLILDQVAAGVAVRMSVLYHLLGGTDEEN